FSSNEALGAPVDCDSGSFSFSHSVSRDDEYSLRFVPMLRDGTPRTDETDQVVLVDATPPPPPVISTNNGMNIFSSIPDVRLEGTVSNDTVMIDCTDPSLLSFLSASSSFQYSSHLQRGQAVKLDFYAVDFAGNRSSPTEIE